MQIRIATLEDCLWLALLKRHLWETSYRGIYPDEKLDSYIISDNEEKFKSMIEKNSQTLYVILKNNLIIGYFSYGKILRPFGTYTHDIGLLYILKAYQGQGIGKHVFEFCKNELKQQGIKEFIVSCNKYNTSAQSFYKHMGGVIVKTDEDCADLSIPQVKFKFLSS